MRIFWLLLAVWLALPAAAQPIRRDGLPGKRPEEYGIRKKKAAENYENALVAMGYGGYPEAIHYLDQALALEPQFDLAIYKRGEALHNLAQRRQSVQAIYGKIMADMLTTLQPLAGRYRTFTPKYRELYYYLAQGYMAQTQYAEAKQAFTVYLSVPDAPKSYEGEARRDLAKAEFAVAAMSKPISYQPRNLGGTINTVGDEYMAYPTADDQVLFFTSRRPQSQGGFQGVDQGYGEDFYVSRRQPDGTWGPAVNIGPPVNSADNEGASCISPDGQTVIFTGCNRPGGVGSCDLYVAQLQGNEWSQPRNLGPKVNSGSWDSHPNLSHDGRTLYFSSGRSGGIGGNDIWYCTWTGTEWSAPRNLGPAINTPGNEEGPFLAADGVTFYFSSDGHPGFGKQDIFLTTRQADGSWAKPRNLGYPLNTPGDEKNIAINSRGTRAYINSDAQPDTYGRIDLYEFELDSTIRPAPATYVRGTVSDSVTGKPIGLAMIQFIDLHSGDTVRNALSNTSTGKFLLSLPLERDYAAFTEARGYLYNSQTFRLADLKGAPFFDLDIRLTPIRVGATSILRNVFFAFNSTELLPESQVELTKLVRFLNANPKLRVEIRGHTDAEGTATYNLDLSRRRAASVQAFLLQAGISPGRLVATGYGEGVPLAGNDTEAGRSLNRRTEFRVLAN